MTVEFCLQTMKIDRGQIFLKIVFFYTIIFAKKSQIAFA